VAQKAFEHGGTGIHRVDANVWILPQKPGGKPSVPIANHKRSTARGSVLQKGSSRQG
jgi:hypothetical protein